MGPPRDAPAQTQDVGYDAGSLIGKGGGGQPDRTQKIRVACELLPQACILLVQGIVARHEDQHATGFEDVEGLGEKEVMQGEAAPGILKFDVCEGHVANDGINAALRQSGIAEVFDADVMSRMQCAGDPSGQAVKLHTDETHAFRGERYEVADPAAWL